VLVVAVAAPDPDGSKPATPDLTIDTLGALDSCRAALQTAAPTTPVSSGVAVPAAAVPGSPTYAG
jgi:hypothetical protein